MISDKSASFFCDENACHCDLLACHCNSLLATYIKMLNNLKIPLYHENHLVSYHHHDENDHPNYVCHGNENDHENYHHENGRASQLLEILRENSFKYLPPKMMAENTLTRRIAIAVPRYHQSPFTASDPH